MSEAPPKRRTQQERKAESERAIIHAALHLFATKGYITTTLNEIGKEAGYTGGLVSHRFGSKEGLLRAVISHIGTRFMQDQLGSAIERDSAEESLCNYIRIYLNEVAVRESRIRTLYVLMGEALGAVPEVQPEIARLNRNARSHLAEIIKRGIASGEFRKDVDPEASAVLILGILRGTVMQYLIDKRAFNVKKVAALVETSALHGLK